MSVIVHIEDEKTEPKYIEIGNVFRFSGGWFVRKGELYLRIEAYTYDPRQVGNDPNRWGQWYPYRWYIVHEDDIHILNHCHKREGVLK